MIESSVLFFPCVGIDEMEEFYHHRLGLSVFQKKGKSIIFDTGYGYLGFVEYEDGRPLATGMCISFNCENREAVDRVYRALAEPDGGDGMTIPRRHPQFPVYSFFLKDPNGYTVEFQKMENE